MMTTDERRGPQSLQETVVSLAGARFEKFYHHSSGVHIVKQLGGTEFRSPAISGTGDFADEAYADYLQALRTFVAEQTESRLRDLERRLSEFAPIGARKVEVQVQLPNTLANDIGAQAREMNVNIDTYLNHILDDCLHLNFDDEAETTSWLKAFSDQRQQRQALNQAAERARCTMYLSLPLSGFEGLERLSARLATGHLNTVSEFVSNVILLRNRRAHFTVPPNGTSVPYAKGGVVGIEATELQSM